MNTIMRTGVARLADLLYDRSFRRWSIRIVVVAALSYAAMLVLGIRVLVSTTYIPARDAVYGLSFYVPATEAAYRCRYWTGRTTQEIDFPPDGFVECPLWFQG